MNLIWEYYIHRLRVIGIPLFSRPIRSRPHNRNRGDIFLKTELDFEIFAGVFILAFSATSMCAWNFYFPTTAELILWRCASTYLLGFSTIGGAYTWILHQVLFEKRKNSNLPLSERSSMELAERKAIRPRIEVLAGKVRRVSGDENPDLTIPISLILPVTFLCVFYCLFRAYILIEDVIALRALPASAFETVNWSQYIPHI